MITMIILINELEVNLNLTVINHLQSKILIISTSTWTCACGTHIDTHTDTLTQTYSKWSSHWTALEGERGVPHMSIVLDGHWSIVTQLVLFGLYLLNKNLILSMQRSFNYCFGC